MAKTEVAKTVAELKAELDAARAKAKAELEATKKAEAELAEKSNAARNEAIATLAAAIKNAMEGMDGATLLRVVSCPALIAVIEGTEPAGDASDIKTALEALEAAGGLKVKRGNGSAKGPRTEGGLLKAQKRMLVWLYESKVANTNRRLLTAAGQGKNPDALKDDDFVHPYGSEYIGPEKNAAERFPLSLLGRGYIEQIETTTEGGTEKRLKITKAGKDAAKVARKELAESAETNGDENE